MRDLDYLSSAVGKGQTRVWDDQVGKVGNASTELNQTRVVVELTRPTELRGACQSRQSQTLKLIEELSKKQPGRKKHSQLKGRYRSAQKT